MPGAVLSRGRLPPNYPPLNIRIPETTLTPLCKEHFSPASALHFEVEPADHSMNPVGISFVPPVRARLV